MGSGCQTARYLAPRNASALPENLEDGQHRRLPNLIESRLRFGLRSDGRGNDHHGDRAVMSHLMTDASQQELGNTVQPGRADYDHVRTFAQSDLDQRRRCRCAFLQGWRGNELPTCAAGGTIRWRAPARGPDAALAFPLAAGCPSGRGCRSASSPRVPPGPRRPAVLPCRWPTATHASIPPIRRVR